MDILVYGLLGAVIVLVVCVAYLYVRIKRSEILHNKLVGKHWLLAADVSRHHKDDVEQKVMIEKKLTNLGQ